MKRRLYLLAGLLLLGIVGTAAARWLDAGETGPATGTVVREEFRASVDATGKLEAAVAFEVGPPSVADFWQYNLTWMIPEGSRVKQNDVIARFDATDIDDRLRDHQAKLEKTLQEREKEERNLQVSLKQLRLDLVKAEGELKEVDLDLSVPEGLVPEVEMEQNRLKRDLAARRVEFLSEKIEFEQQLVQTKLELLDVKREFDEGKIAYYEDAKEKFSVKAPVAGVVVYVPKQNGDRWEIGESVWMLAKILEVADISTLQVEAAVLEVDAARIAPGQTASISIDALPGITLTTGVDSIGRIVHERSQQDPSKVFDAILPLSTEGGPEGLRPGMGVHVSIETDRLPCKLTIPLEAVHLVEEGAEVRVVGRKGAPERRAVVLGPRNATRVVVESGLQEGDRVLLAPAGART